MYDSCAVASLVSCTRRSFCHGILCSELLTALALAVYSTHSVMTKQRTTEVGRVV